LLLGILQRSLDSSSCSYAFLTSELLGSRESDKLELDREKAKSIQTLLLLLETSHD
jgi:hypothetical protein